MPQRHRGSWVIFLKINLRFVKKISIKLFIIIFILLATSSHIFIAAQAQENQEDSRSITISPLTFELTANPGEQINNKIKVINSGPQPIFVRMEVEDFTAVGESGGVVIQDQENDSFSLAKWVTMNESEFTLLPAEQKIIDFSINVPLEGEPGGHYGSILAVASPPDVIAGGGSGVSQKVGSLLLLSVAGEVKENLVVEEFKVGKFL